MNPKLKELKDKIKNLWKKNFVVKEGRSALNNFARPFTIKGEEGFSPRNFLREVKPKVVELFEKNKQTKTKMILSCLMSRTNIATGEEIEEIADFHFLIETNLDGTNEEEMFNEMVERILENLANFFKDREATGDLKGLKNWKFILLSLSP